jgi:hypothetical protein
MSKLNIIIINILNLVKIISIKQISPIIAKKNNKIKE